jgi:hypothetical protein
MTERTETNDGRRDFDFLRGKWQSKQRRLDQWNVGSDTWIEFECELENFPILNGLGNFDELVMHTAQGEQRGVSLRLFSPETKAWSIYWANSRTAELGTPMVGGFKDGRGEFYAHELYDGRWIHSRFIWSRITEASPRWEQAFSVDGARTWETNWVADFTRVG